MRKEHSQGMWFTLRQLNRTKKIKKNYLLHMAYPSSVFTHGQLYIGASRTGDYNQVFVYVNQYEFDNIKHAEQDDHEINKGGNFTRNIVYTEVIEADP